MSERKRTEESCKRFHQILTSERQIKRLKERTGSNASHDNHVNINPVLGLEPVIDFTRYT